MPGLLFLLDAVATAKAKLVVMNLATASILYQKPDLRVPSSFSVPQCWRALRRLFPVPALCLCSHLFFQDRTKGSRLLYL